MKFLETRTEIAKAINFKQYPTIRIDVSETDDYGIVGTHVLIDNGTFRTGEPCDPVDGDFIFIPRRDTW